MAGILNALRSASRLQRAQEQGFDISSPYFHASKQDIDEMQPGYDDGLVFVTPDSEFANTWLGKGRFQERQGGTGSIEGVKKQKEKLRAEANKVMGALSEADRERYYNEVYWPQLSQLTTEAGQADSAIYPLLSRTKKPYRPNKDYKVLEELFSKEHLDSKFSQDLPTLRDAYKDGNYLLYENSKVVDFLKSKGYDSMFLKENSGPDKKFTTLAVFDGQDLRSINAQFDPAKTDSRNLLASGAPVAAGLLGAAAMQPEEVEAAGFSKLLRAFHGSHKDFDKFSSDYIGTGEGAQAYGYGLYSAQARDLGELYRKQAVQDRTDFFDPSLKDDYEIGQTAGQMGWNLYDKKSGYLDLDMPTFRTQKEAEEALESGKLTGQVGFSRIRNKLEKQLLDSGYSHYVAEEAADRVALAMLEDGDKFDRKHSLGFYKKNRDIVSDGAVLPDEVRRATIDALELSEPIRLESSKGRLYEIDIDASPDELLDWDKPVSAQSSKVQDAVEDILRGSVSDPDGVAVRGFDGETIDHSSNWSPQEWKFVEKNYRRLGNKISTNLDLAKEKIGDKGESYHQALSSRLGGQDKLAKALQERGVKGIQYKDAFSRTGEGGTSNYVVFDDKLISIAKKYGVTLPVAAAMLQQPEEAEAAFFTSTANLIRLGMLTPESAQNPRAVKGANTKYDRAMRESRAFRARENLRADIENQTETLDIGQRQLLEPNDLLGKVGVPVTGDTSVTGRTIQTIGGIDLDSPVQVEGGANFPLRYQDQGYGWASMRAAADKKQTNFRRAQEATEGGDPVGIFSAMSRDAINFSTPVAEALYLQAIKLPLAKTDVAEFDRYIRSGPKGTQAKKQKGVKGWVGLQHPDALDQLLGRGDYAKEGAGEIRKQFVETIELAQFRDRGFPIKEDVYAEAIESELQGAQPGDAGFSIFDAMPGTDAYQAPVHQSYDTIIPGTYLGGMEQNIPSRVMFPRIYEGLDEQVNYQGQPLTEQQKLGSLMMRNDLYEPLDERWAEGVSTYLKNNPKKATTAGLLAAGNATAAEDEQTEFTGGMGVRVPPAPVEPVPFRAAMPSTPEPTTSEKAQGVLDAILNMGQAAVAPISNAPHTLIQALTSGQPTTDVRAAQQQRLGAMDYQPGELGQQYTDAFGQFVGDQINQSNILNALRQSRILQTPFNAINQLPDRARLVGGSILDALPL